MQNRQTMMDQMVNEPKATGRAQLQSIEKALSLDQLSETKKTRRKWLRYLMFIALAISAIYGYQHWTAQSATKIVYTSEPATLNNMIVEVSASGTLQPLTKVDVSSEQSGVVREVRFKENDFVKKGDVLAVLDTTTLSAQVERAQATVISSKARIADAKTTLKELEQTLERAKSLKARGTLSVQDLETALAKRDRAESSLLSTKADLAVSEAELRVQQAGLAKSTIYAPIDGVILSRTVDIGQTVAASLSAPILFVIAQDLKRMKLEAAIDEADIGMISNGQKAKFKVDAYTDKNFNASIVQIAFASQTIDNVVSYQAELDVNNADLSLRPGMTANVDIIVREASGILTVPNAAFRYQPSAVETKRPFSLTSLFMPRFPRSKSKPALKIAADGTRTLYVMQNGLPVAAKVKTGSTDGTITEITTGLRDGDSVVITETTEKAN